MGVKEFMTRGVSTIVPETDVRDAFRRLESASGGLLAVIDRGRLVGTLTTADIKNGRMAAPRGSLHVSDILCPDLSYCFEDTEVDEAELLMRNNGLDRVVVLDRHGRAVGTLALSNVSPRQEG